MTGSTAKRSKQHDTKSSTHKSKNPVRRQLNRAYQSIHRTARTLCIIHTRTLKSRVVFTLLFCKLTALHLQKSNTQGSVKVARLSALAPQENHAILLAGINLIWMRPHRRWAYLVAGVVATNRHGVIAANSPTRKNQR